MRYPRHARCASRFHNYQPLAHGKAHAMDTRMPKNTDTADFLKRWTLPSSYIGATWEGYWVAPVGRTRDSDLLTESNWDAQLKTLRAIKEPADWPHDDPPFQVVSENHWLCGWVEWVAIHPDASEHLKAACEIAGALDSYPVLDETDWSTREYEAACEAFDRYSVRELGKDLAATFEVKPRTVERWEEIAPDKVLAFMMDKVGLIETRAEGGGAHFVWESFEHSKVTRHDLAVFLFQNRKVT